jgi:hypothetical protein
METVIYVTRTTLHVTVFKTCSSVSPQIKNSSNYCHFTSSVGPPNAVTFWTGTARIVVPSALNLSYSFCDTREVSLPQSSFALYFLFRTLYPHGGNFEGCSRAIYEYVCAIP